MQIKKSRRKRDNVMSGQWQPYSQKDEIERESTEVGESIETDEVETEDSETDNMHDRSRFRRRTD
jgi:hypothetical protein